MQAGLRAGRAGFGLLAMAVLSACAGAPPASNPPSDVARAEGRGFLSALSLPGRAKDDEAKPPLAKVSLAGGDVVVAGPEGYCLDSATTQARRERGFAVIASCQILTGGKVGEAVAPMIVTVTVGPRGASADLPTPEALAEAAGAPLASGRQRGGLVRAHLSRGGAEMFPGSDARYWRGAFVQGERMVGLALYAPKGSALAGTGGGAMLARVQARIAALSPSKATPAASPVSAVEKPGKPKQSGLLSRLFNRQDLPY